MVFELLYGVMFLFCQNSILESGKHWWWEVPQDSGCKSLCAVRCVLYTGRAACGCVNPRNEKDVRSILKFALPVTEKDEFIN